jgi:hypothetical protein
MRLDSRRLPMLFKLSVRLQGGPKRAAHAAAWARVRRLAAHTTATQAARRLVCRSGSGRGDDWSMSGGVAIVGRLPTEAAWATRAGTATGRSAGHCRRAPGLAARSVPGRSSKAQGRFASQATATTRPPLTSEPLRPSGRCRGQADGLPFSVRAASPDTDSSPISPCQARLDTERPAPVWR